MCFPNLIRREGSFLSWNCRGISNKINDLIDLINLYKPIFICFQETKLKENSDFTFENYNFEHKPQILREDEIAKGGVGFLIKAGITYKEIKIDSIFQALAFQLDLEKKITICSIYIPPNFKFVEKDLEKLTKQLPAPFILVGDFNSHNALWFDKRTDLSGKIIENFLINNNINLLDEEGQTFRRGILESHIDLTLVSPELHTDLFWELHDDPCSSDHVPVIITPKWNIVNTSTPKWNFNKANWELFKSRANFDVPIENFGDVNDISKYVQQVILDAATESIPVTKPMEGKISVPWWNARLTESKKLKKAAYKKYNKRPSNENSLFYRKKNAEHKRLLEESKKDYLFHFLSGINNKTSISDCWKKIGKLNPKGKKKSITSLNVRETEITGKREIANTLAKNMSDISSFEGRNQKFLDYKNRNDAEFDFSFHISRPPEGSLHSPITFMDFTPVQSREVFNTPITSKELYDAINKCKINSASGEDNIHYAMIKNLSEHGLKFILAFFNIIFLKGFYPNSWRTAKVIPILKPESDPKDPNSYRPISLISCLSKLLEGIINKRLIWFLEKNNLLNINQSGFRTGRCTLDNLTSLVTEIQQAFAAKKYHITLFLDLQKAYDTCWKKHVLKQLKSFNLTGSLPIYIQNFLCNRTISVETNGAKSNTYELDLGIPQGSSLSGTLFLIAVDSIGNCIKNYMYKSFFVDDARVSYITNDLKQGEIKLQKVLNDLVAWGDKTGFSFSDTKSVVMIFNRKSGDNPKINLKLGDKPLKVVTEKKFLGMLFDNKLDWSLHLEKVKNKCISILNLLKTIASSKRKTNSTILLNVYKSLVLPRLEYGCQAYSSATVDKLRILDPVHHQGLRICLGAFRTTPIESLYVESNINSLENRRNLENMSYFFRVHQIEKQYRHQNIVETNRPFTDLNINKTFSFKVRENLQKYQIEELDIIKVKPLPIPPWFIPNIEVCFKVCENTKKESTTEELKHIFNEHKHVSKISMYTDGSKSEKGTGAGVVVFRKCNNMFVHDQYKIKLHKLASAFTAELVALEAAVNSLKHVENTSCTIYSDSKSALQSILKYDSKNPIVQNIHILLLNITGNNTIIKFCWVPAHCGIRGNELADKVAKNATKFSKNCTNPILYSDIKTFLKEQINNKCSLFWNTQVNNKLFQIDSKIGKKDFSGFTSRMDEIKFTRLRLGHTKITHEFRFLGQQQPICNVCVCDLTVKHLLIECPKYEQKRIACFGHYELNISDILERGNYKKILNILNFLRQTGLFNEI